MTVEIDGASLSLEQVVRVARSGEPVSMSEATIERMRQSRLAVERVLARDDAVYGLTTGLGEHKRHRLAASDVPRFNRELLENHLIGHGPRVPDEVVRATMLRLANGFAKGTVGVRPLLAERLVEALNVSRHPLVRLLGSAGEADLAPLADLAHGLFRDVELQAKEGLALVNNNSFSTALATLAVADTRALIDSITVAGALDLEAFGANLSVLDPVVGESRPYPGLQTELAGLRRALEGSSLWQPGAARNLQDPLSYRSIVQLGGAARDALAFVEGQLAIELNAHHDNPIVMPGEDRIISAGNYEALPVAAALDFLRIALAPVLTASLERAMKLLQTPLSGLPGGLSEKEGLVYGGLGAISWSAHALTAEARLLAQPVSFELATTTPEEGIGDRITMAPLAARRLAEQTALGHRIVAIELLCAAQALDLRALEKLGAQTRRAFGQVRELVPFAGSAAPYPSDLEPLVALVRSGSVALTRPGT
ncbi:MAG TPA: aromatic amino acid lyase [Solirubrobacteraceae bacterium]|nr:aromatic amino acid lyase [Solirubrobacteraceae bacterium]